MTTTTLYGVRYPLTDGDGAPTFGYVTAYARPEAVAAAPVGLFANSADAYKFRDEMARHFTDVAYEVFEQPIGLPGEPDHRDRIQALEADLIRTSNSHQHDIATIGERLMQEACERGWCEVYDEVIEELNTELAVELPTRKRTFNVVTTYTGTIEFSVEARNEDEAIEIAEHQGKAADRERIIRDVNGGHYRLEDYGVDEG